MEEKDNDTQEYDDSEQYTKLDENVYFDEESEETVIVLTPEERQLFTMDDLEDAGQGNVKKTEEEVVAEKLIKLISDIRLDLDDVGSAFASVAHTSLFYRLENIYLSAAESGGIIEYSQREKT